jgi:hypothetical protein
VEQPIYFRRRQFYGGHNTQLPKWHIHAGELTSEYGIFKGRCGYTFGNTHGALLISRETPPRPLGELCGKCAARDTEIDHDDPLRVV